MKTLVVAATELEIAPFNLKNRTCEILITGVGVASTIYHLTKKLLTTKYDLVIQAGIAGAFNPNFIMGEVVVVKKDIFADAGIIEDGKYITLFEAGLAKNEHPFEQGWLINDHPISNASGLKSVTAITVNTVGDNLAQITRYKEKFMPDIESMEGAGLHYTCIQEHVPFIQLRSISNIVGIRDKSKWYMNVAINNLCNELEKLTTAFK